VSAHRVPSSMDGLISAQKNVAAWPGTAEGAQAGNEQVRPGEGISATLDQRAIDVLRLVQLGHLADKLDMTADWGRILSLGEQQRLAFGRVLLAEPDAIFLDEATSAMDEGLEDAMYRLVRGRLPATILLSVGHRSTLFAHHPRQLVLKGDGTGAWEITDTDLLR